MKAYQTDNTVLNSKNKTEFNLLTHYTSIIKEIAPKVKHISKYVVMDAYFSKVTIVDAVKEVEMELISRLRKDCSLKYLFNGKRTGKKGAPRKFGTKIDVKNLKEEYFTFFNINKEIKVYAAEVYSTAFKRNILLAVKSFIKMERKFVENYTFLQI